MAYAPRLLTLPADRPRLTRALAAASGAATTLVFAPWSLAWAAPLVLLPLLFVCLTQSPREAAGHAFWYGLGLFLAGTYWIDMSVVFFGQAPAWIAVVLMVGLAVIMAAWLYLAGWVIARLAHGEPLLLLVVAPAGWVLVEWLRGWVASGFPWLAFGYSQVDTPLAGWAPLGGIYAASFAVVFSSAGLLAATFTTGRQRWIALLAGILPWVTGAGLGAIDWTRPDGDGFRVTVLQAGLSQDQKWRPENRQATLDFYRDNTRIARGSTLVVWPEVAVPSLLSRERAFVAQLQSDARESGQSILFGVLEDVDDRGTERIYNSLLMLDGQRLQVYRKRHLVPFGEYFPVPARVREWMRMMSLPHNDISAGDDVQSLLAMPDGTRLAGMICYEDAYNGEQRYALPDAGVLVNVSNDAWFGDSIAPHQHLQIARMRSLEAGRPGVRATNTGISAFIGHDGELLSKGPQFRPATLTDYVQPRTGATPFARAGNLPVLLLSVLLLAGVRVRHR